MTDRPTDESFMRHAIALAMRGRGTAEPNPLVGCVIIKDNRIVAEGFHARYGSHHAERSAINHRTDDLRGATAYVTLEPCCHTNKQTPPCVPALIEAGIARVVVGAVDPNQSVNGKGIAQLRQAGITVDTGLLREECLQLLAPFIARVSYNRPYITLKWAQSAEGLVAGSGGAPVRITGQAANRAVHELRARSNAIMIGIGTALLDDPELTIRHARQVHPLNRIVLDSQLRLPLDSRLVRSISTDYPLMIVCNENMDTHRRDSLMQAGAEIFTTDSRDALQPLFGEMASRRWTHLLVEPGPTLAQSLIQQNRYDRLWVFESQDRLNINDGVTAPAIPENAIATTGRPVGRDRLTEYLNTQSPLFATNVASPDVALIGDDDKHR